MSTTRKFFHDRLVLFLLTLNTFLSVMCLLTVVFRLGDTAGLYISRYQPNLGITDASTTGGVTDVLAFPVFAFIVLISFSTFGLKLYAIRKHYAWMFMSLATLILVLSLVISYRLLSAH